MKKLLVTLIALMLVIGMAFAVSAATTSPVKSYDSAAMGDLLYTVNFKGDDVFKPKKLGDNENMTYTASADGSALTIKAKSGVSESRNYWGGKIEGLPVNNTTYYTMTYKVNAKASAVGNNSIGVGGVYVADTGYQGVTTNEPKFYNNYGRHNAVAAADQRSALSNPMKINSSYVMWSSLAKKFATDADGYITMAISFHGPTGKFMSYYLTTDNTWQLIETQSFTFDKDTTMGFAVYAYYPEVNTTVKDAKIYKGAIGDIKLTSAAPETTVPETTKASETTKAPTTTKAPETTKAAATTTATHVDEKGGCGSSVAITGIALVAAVGTCTTVICKKRKDD